MKKFRKISVLILALALICALAVTTFAATDGWSEVCESYDVEMEGTVNRQNASGTIYVNYIYGMSYARVDMTCTYYPMPAGSSAVTNDYYDYDYFSDTSSAGATRSYSASVAPAEGCFCMIAVTYKFSMRLGRTGIAFESIPRSIEY